MCSKYKGENMSVNFGYGGMGMMGGMNGMNSSGGNTFQEMKAKYGCEHCYQYGPMQYNYQMQVNPLPQQVTHPSFISRLLKKFTG